MNYQTFIFISFFSLAVSSGCRRSGAEKQYDLKEEKLAKKENQLNKLEQELKAREKQILEREIQLDSLNLFNDTLGVYNPQLVGTWLVTMECVETTCEGYAVGDTKTEHWSLSYLKRGVVVKVMADNKVVRTYFGVYKENRLNLSAWPAPDAKTQINVVLSPEQTGKLLSGQRFIDRGKDCRVVFNLKAEKETE